MPSFCVREREREREREKPEMSAGYLVPYKYSKRHAHSKLSNFRQRPRKFLRTVRVFRETASPGSWRHKMASLD